MSDPKAELIEKVTALINHKFAGDWDRAFRHYAAQGGNSGLVDRETVKVMLAEAGIGNGLTRGAWTSGVVKELDTDRDGGISFDEFRKVFRNN